MGPSYAHPILDSRPITIPSGTLHQLPICDLLRNSLLEETTYQGLYEAFKAFVLDVSVTNAASAKLRLHD